MSLNRNQKAMDAVIRLVNASGGTVLSGEDARAICRPTWANRSPKDLEPDITSISKDDKRNLIQLIDARIEESEFAAI